MPLHARAKIGRNDPCPCGSGRKYKHCCIQSHTPSIDSLWARQHEDYARLTREMTRFAERKFEKQIYDAWQDFNLSDIPELLEQSPDELQVFMPYFLFQWDPDRPSRSKTAHRRGGVVARWYMLEKSKQLTAMERLFLDQAATQPMSFYEVLWSVPGDRVGVRDVLIGGIAEVIERSGSRTMRPGDLIYAQLWYQPEFAVFGSTAPLCIRPDKKVEVIELRKKLRKKIAKQNRNLNADDLLRYSVTIRAVYLDIRDALHAPLRLANTDGDPLIFHTLTFRIESADAAFEALAPLAVGHSREELLDEAELDEGGKLHSVDFDWIREGNRKFKSWDNTILGRINISAKRLIAEVNSENRAKRLRKEIEKRLGAMATHERTLTQTLEQLRKNTPQAAEVGELHEAEVEALLADPEARKLLQATIQKQTERWVHEKIPALGGRTPIEAIRDPDGKEAVEALLAHWERHDETDVSPSLIRPDISAIRRLLNLAHPVS
ncbi:MAG TPA: SEC-C metal-binding domain-containing protein [Terriglobales bacterium]